MRIQGPVALAILASLSPLSAQDAQPLKSKAEEVLLDVVVRDKKGAPLTNLTQSDFTVFDNGVARPIRAFRLVRGGDATDASGHRMQHDPTSQIRMVTLVFGKMDTSGRMLSRQAALEFLKTDLPDNVWVSVFVLDQSLKVVQDFTTDKSLLSKAVERASTSSYADFGSASNALRDRIQETIGPNQYGRQSPEEQTAIPSLASGGSGAGALGAADSVMVAALLQMLEFSERAESTQSGRNTIYALLAAVQAESTLPGRKSLIYFTDGFIIPQGAQEAFQSVISTANRSNLSFYPIDSRGLISTGMNNDATSHLGGAAQSSMNGAQPTPTGDNAVSTESAMALDDASDAGKRNTQDTLANLAQQTGGFLTANTNDFRGPVHRIAEDLQTFYQLSYDPSIAVYDGSFHKVEVKTTRADLRVQTREGYFALPDSIMQHSLSALDMPLLRALTITPPPHAFPFESGAMHFRGEDRSMTCGFLIDMPMTNVTVRENSDKTKLTGGVAYIALVKDEKGDIVKKLQGDIPVELTPDQEISFKQSRFTEMEYFDIPPGRYSIGVALMDKESGQTTARHSSLFVPRIDSHLAMSSVSLIRKWRAKEAGAAADDPFAVGEQTVTPTLAPRINKSVSTSLPFYFVAYPNAGNPAPLALTIEFTHDGKSKRIAVADLPEPDAQGRIQYVANSPIAQFDPGNYAVHFIVTQGTERAEENFAILLEP